MSDGRLRYELDGAPDAPVLVLGPSLGTELEMWNAQIPALTGRWRVLRYDLRGHGGSPVPPGRYTAAGLAADVLALLDELGLDRVAYGGISLGGAIGQWLALHHPDRLSSLVLCCTAACFDPATFGERAERVRAEGVGWLVDSAAGRWFTPAFPKQAPGETERLLGMLRRTPPEGYAGCCEALAAFDVRDRLGEITAPTRVIAGTEDPVIPIEKSRELAERIPGADLVVVPHAAHLANVEQPAAVTEAILGHLERLRPERSREVQQ